MLSCCFITFKLHTGFLGGGGEDDVQGATLSGGDGVPLPGNLLINYCTSKKYLLQSSEGYPSPPPPHMKPWSVINILYLLIDL